MLFYFNVTRYAAEISKYKRRRNLQETKTKKEVEEKVTASVRKIMASQVKEKTTIINRYLNC